MTLLEGVLAVHSQGVSSKVRGKHSPRGVDRTLVDPQTVALQILLVPPSKVSICHCLRVFFYMDVCELK